MHSFSQLKKWSKLDKSGFIKTKLALLGDTPTQFLAKAIAWAGLNNALDIELYEADYNQIDSQLMVPSSSYYQFNADYTVIFFSAKKMKQKFLQSPGVLKANMAASFIEHTRILVGFINSNTNTTIILFNLDEQNNGVFGNYSNKTVYSFTYQLRKINVGLMELSQQVKNLFINDVASLHNTYGTAQIFSPLLFAENGLPFNLDFTAQLAVSTVDIVGAVAGKFKKCLILDLDNTLWGGIIGDDGIENIQLGDLGIGRVYTEIQSWAKSLQERGIILCVCSKNDEAIAMEVFEKHPDMILRPDDIAVFLANWENKADNIRHIQSVLNIGFDSMVFLDDNPFERNFIRKELPAVCVPELPVDPAEYMGFLKELNLFETASFNTADADRTNQYKTEAVRALQQQQQIFTNEANYLQSLQMKADVEHFHSGNIARVTQLIQRSNQFNLRTQRYNEEQVVQMTGNPQFECMAISLADKYGGYGLIFAVILQRLDEQSFFIDTLVMSCRVLKRGVENFALNEIVKMLIGKGAKKLVGEYLPTAKNGLVLNLLRDSGFTEKDGFWELESDNFSPYSCFIQKQ